MLWTIAVILGVLWLLGLVTSYTMGGLIHILLVVAIIVIVVNLHPGPTRLATPESSVTSGGIGAGSCG